MSSESSCASVRRNLTRFRVHGRSPRALSRKDAVGIFRASRFRTVEHFRMSPKFGNAVLSNRREVCECRVIPGRCYRELLKLLCVK